MGSSEQQRAVVCFTTPFLSSYGGIILGMFFSMIFLSVYFGIT